MYSELFLFFTLVSGSGYTYCLLRAHFLEVKMDHFTRIPRSRCGEIRLSDLRLAKASTFDEHYALDAETAILYLQLSNFIAVGYFFGLALFFIIELL
ncbi:hypothetical protein [Mucilaginibacter glaciei]|uniref:Uncharacterized protein n=1 Tax=Mucilaginibacter glaciei TaxID=2772109 RepID=A0A926S413_9SPHI|nr:hypothetical protein [Mucilaginibacter glaciei]MBD1395502.1 hypothetical protein [Mucilaginibacter glaciei]